MAAPRAGGAAAAAAAPAAREPVLSPAQEAALLQKLSNLAADDAKHDFGAVRGKGGAFARVKALIKRITGRDTITFSSIFNDLNQKPIGTHNLPQEPLRDEDGAWLAALGKSREDFVSEKEGEYPASGVYQYRWKFMEFAKRRAADEKETNWIPTSAEIFEYLTAYQSNKDAFYFLIDAVNVKFYHPLFMNQNNTVKPSDPHKKACYIDCREGDNDAAGKLSMAAMQPYITATKNSAVRLEIVKDEYNTHIVYPRYEAVVTDSRKFFNSKFNVTVNRDKKDVTTTFYDNKFEHVVQVNKGIRQEHPNSVNELFPKLAQSYTDIQKDKKGGKTSQDIQYRYFATLQQKRSGDWLQVLSCLDTDRYPDIPKGNVIWLCTEDIICAAYAISLGVNVLYTWWDAKGYYTLRFARTDQGVSREQQILNKVRSLPDPMNMMIGNYEGQPAEKYLDAISHYTTVAQSKYEAIETQIKTAIKEFTDSLQPFLKEKDPMRFKTTHKSAVEDKIRNILIGAVKLVTFYNTLPNKWKYLKEAGIAEIQKLQSPETTVDAVNEGHIRLVRLYEETIQKLRTLNNNGQGRSGVVSLNTAINAAILSMIENSKAAQKAHAENGALIKRLTIFSKLFNKANAGTHAVGIFQMISTIPEPEIKSEIAEALALLGPVAAGSDEAQLNKDISAFFKAASYILIRDGAKPGRDELPDAELLESIQEADNAILSTGADAAGGAGGGASGGGRQRGGAPAPGGGGGDNAESQLTPEETDFFISPFQVGLFAPAVTLLQPDLEEAYATENRNAIEALREFEEAAVVPAAAAGANGGQGGGGRRKRVAHPITGLFFFVRELIYFYLQAGREVEDAARVGQLFLLWTQLYEPYMKHIGQEVNPFSYRMFFGLLERLCVCYFPLLSTTPPPKEIAAFIDALGVENTFLSEFSATTNEYYYGKWHFKGDIDYKPYAQILNIVTGLLKENRKVDADAVEAGLLELYRGIPDILRTVTALETTWEPAASVKSVTKAAAMIAARGGGYKKTRRAGRRGGRKTRSRRH